MCEGVRVCVFVAMLQSLRYPLLLSTGAMGLVVPRGRRWHQNPQSHSEKVTKIQASHPHLYSPTHSPLVTHSSGWALPGLLVPHQFPQSFAVMFYVHERERKRNAFEMSNAPTGSSVMEKILESAGERGAWGDNRWYRSFLLLRGWDRKQKRDRCTRGVLHQKWVIN